MPLTLSFTHYELPLQHPFSISRYTVTQQKTVIVSISDGVFSGFGEATINPYYNSTVEKLTKSLTQIKKIILRDEDLHPNLFWQKIAPLLQDDYFALCAIDVAYWDFYAKRQQKNSRDFWSAENMKTPLTSYTIGIDSIEKMQQKIIEKPWPLYKIKLGTSHDLQIVEALRKVTDATFRIDANCAWTAQQTIEYTPILKELNVEFIEQPLHPDNLKGIKLLKEKTVLPILADESCQRKEDVLKCASLFHGINIKLMKCGGITPALQMIETARENNLLVMAGCMTESTVGISALTQLAPLLDFIDADGAFF